MERSVPTITGESLGAGLKRLVRKAYLEPGTRAYGIVLDLTAFLVMISLLSMVLEGIPELAEPYAPVFFAVELVVVVLFICDYAASVYTASNRWGYVLGFWGVIDVLAILPFFLTVTNITGVRAGRTLHTLRTMRTTRALRALRVLRVIRVAKVIHRTQEASRMSSSAGADPHAHSAAPSLWRDFQFGVIALCSVLALAEVILEWESDQLFWLLFGGTAAANLAVRRWCLRHGRRSLATVFAATALALGGGVFAWALSTSDPRSLSIALVTALFVAASVVTLEQPIRRPHVRPA